MTAALQTSPYLELLKNRIHLDKVPFSERGSRLIFIKTNDHFSFRLAERWLKRDQQLAAYRHRKPLIEEWKFLGEDGADLPVEIITYPHMVEFQSRLGCFRLVFVDAESVLFILPAGRFGVSFLANLDSAQADRRGGVLRLTGEIQRSIAYTTNARILSDEIESAGEQAQRVTLQFEAGEGGALLVNITPRLGFNRYLPDVNAALEQAARRWHDWFAAVPEVREDLRLQYYYAWWVMRTGLISPRYYTTREAMTPSKLHYVGVWQWDAFFHALAYRHVDMQLAQNQLRILLDHQRSDGMIPDAVHDEGVVTHLDYPVEADVTKPPLIAWSAWKLYEMDRDKEFLDEIYAGLRRWNSWWYEKNDRDRDGLCEYWHPFSSGLDDSPLWDEGMPVKAPDLNTYLCMQQDALARIAHEIGEDVEAKKWQEGAEAAAQAMLRKMWDASAGLFWALKDDRPLPVRTPFNLFPILTGRMPPSVCQRLVEHLVNPEEFWAPYPVPSVAMNDPKFNPEQMWRGPTWMNVNYLLIEGLRLSGFRTLADELRRRTLDLMAMHPDIYEYYHPLTGEKPPKAAPVFGWSSAVFIDLAISASREGGQE